MSPRRPMRIVHSIVAPLLVMTTIAVVLAVQIGRLEARAVLVDRSDQMLAKAHEAQTRVMGQEAALRGWVMSGDPRYRVRYEGESVDALLTNLDALVVDPDQHERLASLRRRYAEVVATTDGLEGRQSQLDQLNADFSLFLRHERALRAGRANDSRREVRHTIVLSSVLLVACAGLLAFFSRAQVRRVADGYERALDERRRDEELREVFLGILGHDLQNPLTAILISASQAARRSGGDDVQKRTLARVTSAGERMSRMIGQLLDMTRARSGGGLRVDRRLGSFGETCRRVVDEARAANPTRVIDFVTHGDLRSAFDADRMAQVLSNLIGNAIVHGASDLPILVVARRVGTEVELAVNNHGPTIPDEQRAAIFDPFRRGHVATERAKHGLGLGLFIAKQIMLAHGGDLSLTSEPVPGTTFRAMFPANDTTTAEARIGDAPHPTAGPAAHGTA